MHIPFISFISFSIFLGLFGGPQAARRCRKSYPSLVLTSDITLCPCLFLHLHLSLHSGIYVRFQYFVLHSSLSLLNSLSDYIRQIVASTRTWYDFVSEFSPLSLPLSTLLSSLVSSCRLSCVYLRNFYCPLWVSLGVWARVSVHSCCVRICPCLSAYLSHFSIFHGFIKLFYVIAVGQMSSRTRVEFPKLPAQLWLLFCQGY